MHLSFIDASKLLAQCLVFIQIAKRMVSLLKSTDLLMDGG